MTHFGAILKPQNLWNFCLVVQEYLPNYVNSRFKPCPIEYQWCWWITGLYLPVLVLKLDIFVIYKQLSRTRLRFFCFKNHGLIWLSFQSFGNKNVHMEIRALVQESYGSELCYSNNILNSIFNTSTLLRKPKKLVKIRNLRYDPKKNKGLEKENTRQFREKYTIKFSSLNVLETGTGWYQ